MYRRLVRLSTDSIRHSTVMLAVAGFLAGTIGLPTLRLNRSGKDRSQPFPCQDHRCGCSNAEQCWRSCCCFTNRQKLAWAAEHGVTPPAYVSVAAEREQPVASTSACTSQQNKSCCEHESKCHDQKSQCVQHDEHDAAAPTLAFDFVLAIQARQCQGQAQLWLALGAVGMPPPLVALNLESLDCGEVLIVAETLSGVSSSPATPPPRA
jgi:hypothetical protein